MSENLDQLQGLGERKVRNFHSCLTEANTKELEQLWSADCFDASTPKYVPSKVNSAVVTKLEFRELGKIRILSEFLIKYWL